MTVLNATPKLSPGISHLTYHTAYAPFTPSNSGQRSPPTYYRGCWHVVSRGFFCRYRLVSSLLKAVYDPKAFVPHAASLRQGCPHCARFPTAASRRSLGRVSVPIWPVGLSTRLPVVGTVGRYPAVYLMGRGAIPSLRRFARRRMRGSGVVGCYPRFPAAIPEEGAGSPRVTQPFATRFPPRRGAVRLACVRRAASVHPEPGSNSPSKVCWARMSPSGRL